MNCNPSYRLSVRKYGVNTVHTIYVEDPHPQSYASYLLMKRELWMAAGNWHLSDPEGWEQLQFNQKFLRDVLEKHGELHCEYCGEPNLVLKEWNQVRKFGDLIATADHFIPKSLDKLKYSHDINNLVVCCEECNRRKADKIWDEETLKYKYGKD